jgi:hypothetical protein
MTKHDLTQPEQTNDPERRIIRVGNAAYRGMDPPIDGSDLNAALTGGTTVSSQLSATAMD